MLKGLKEFVSITIMSNVRQQLENWLSTIEVNGSVLDVAGIHLPIKGRTKTWDVDDYKLLDVKKTFKGRVPDYQEDINYPTQVDREFDNVFCIEALYQSYDPMQVFKNFNKWTKLGGRLFLSTHFMFPYHIEVDAMRLTRYGVSKLLSLNGFEIINIIPRMARLPDVLKEFSTSECKSYKHPGEIGYLVEAIKIK
jgi:hypothetical protein